MGLFSKKEKKAEVIFIVSKKKPHFNVKKNKITITKDWLKMAEKGSTTWGGWTDDLHLVPSFIGVMVRHLPYGKTVVTFGFKDELGNDQDNPIWQLRKDPNNIWVKKGWMKDRLMPKLNKKYDNFKKKEMHGGDLYLYKQIVELFEVLSE